MDRIIACQSSQFKPTLSSKVRQAYPRRQASLARSRARQEEAPRRHSRSNCPRKGPKPAAEYLSENHLGKSSQLQTQLSAHSSNSSYKKVQQRRRSSKRSASLLLRLSCSSPCNWLQVKPFRTNFLAISSVSHQMHRSNNYPIPAKRQNLLQVRKSRNFFARSISSATSAMAIWTKKLNQPARGYQQM